MSTKVASELDKPWYRHAWVWFIIALPVTAVVAGIVTVSIAYKHKPQIIKIEKSILSNSQNAAVEKNR